MIYRTEYRTAYRIITSCILTFFIVSAVLILIAGCSNPGEDPGGYTVTLKLQGGVYYDGTGDTKLGGAFAPTPLREILSSMTGYPDIAGDKKFAVWNTEPDGSGEDYIGDSIIDGDITLYAIYGEVINSRESLGAIRCGDEERVYTLDTDISLSLGSPWEPLCGGADPFKGRLYGKGYMISYFATKSSPGERPSYAGLFAHMEDAVITDLAMLGVRVYGSSAAGAVAGSAVNSAVRRVDITGWISSGGYAGGVAGVINGSVIDKSAFGEFNSRSEQIITGGSAAGGIAGYASASVVDEVSSWVQISAPIAGGTVGISESGEIRNSLSGGLVSADTAGGIAGLLDNSRIYKSYSDSRVSGITAGGLAGELMAGSVTESAAFGLILKGTNTGRTAGRADSASVNNSCARRDAVVNNTAVSDSAGNGEGRDIRDMRKSPGFFANELGFDFTYVWTFPPHYEYPRLKWERVPAYTEIWTAAELKRMSRDLNGFYALRHDIELLEFDDNGTIVPWAAVGDSMYVSFTGRLDGNGFSIKNLALRGDASGDDVQNTWFGLFGRMDNATVTDLNIIGVLPPQEDMDGNIYTGGRYTGALAGQAVGSRIERVKVSGAVTGFINGGGIAGTLSNNSVIAHSSFNGEATGGGIAANITLSSLLYSSVTGKIAYQNPIRSHNSGGLAGSAADSLIYSVHSAADVETITAPTINAGGLFGTVTNSEIINSFSAGSVYAGTVDYVSPTTDVSVAAGGIAAVTANSSFTASVTLAESVSADIVNTMSRTKTSSAARISGRDTGSVFTAVHANRDMSVEADDRTGVFGLDLNKTDANLIFFRDSLGWDFENIWEMSGEYPSLRGQ
jgi:hypothetical protein